MTVRLMAAMLGAIFAAGVVALPAMGEDAPSPEKPAAAENQESERPPYITESIRGRVHYWGKVLHDDFEIKLVPEASERLLVLRSPDGVIHPIVEDLRGRAFRRDKRLFKMDLELRVRRYQGSPLVQIINMYEIDEKGDKFIVDYWCDICSIVMFQNGPCDCCQDNNRLRKRPADE